MTDDGAAGAAGAAGADQPGVATASYVSTQAIIDREYRLLARRQLGLPGFWRRFVRRRILVAVLVVVVIVVLALVDDGITALGAVRGIVLMLVAIGVLTALDVWLTRRRIFRAHRVVVTSNCPPGTVVSASYSPAEFTFSLPGHRTVIEAASLAGGVHEGGILLLEAADGGWVVVPDELLGVSGLDVVRTVLGERLVER
jgi:hypothetical protein